MLPIIGITAKPQNVKASGGVIPSQLVTQTYIKSVTRAGGVPILLVPVDVADVSNVLDRIDGLVMTGGGDVDPATYGAAPRPELRGVNQSRDTFELELARLAFERKIPTFAICRGHQLMNVAFGGTLFQDVASEGFTEDHDQWNEAAWLPHAEAVIDEGSRIAGIIGAGTHGTNSIHHQAIDQLGTGLRVVGKATDGTIEAVEHEDASWDFLSVQWHPEYLSDRGHADSHALFSAFVESAAKYAANS